jgi:lactate permease
MHWTQNYAPFGSPLLATLVAALPIVLLLGLLATGRVSAPRAALAGLLAALAAAVFAFVPPEVSDPGSGGRMAWAGTVLAAAANGAAFGLLPIGWIVLAAIFLYALTVDTGQFEIVKHSVLVLSNDRRVQALMIAFCFGAFVEGAAGFGTPVAISAALLMGAGFKPLHAAGLALIANTSPVAFGALGTPIITLAQVTLPQGMAREAWEFQISQMAGRQLPFFSLIVPAWLVFTMAGWRGVRGVWPALVVCGGSFALVQFLVANFVGPSLVDVAGGLASLAALALFVRVWRPAQPWRFADEAAAPSAAHGRTYTRGQVVSAWVPWLLLSLFVFLWGLPAVKDRLDSATSVPIPVPGLHQQVQRVPPVVPQPRPEDAVFKFNWLSATGTGIFLAAVLSACWLRVAPARFLLIFGRTCFRMRWPLFTIACMLALAYVTRYGGMDATLGLAFTRTGRLYPFGAALLGWLGVALTGSDTSSNALFGSLQKITAEQLVRDRLLGQLSERQAVLLLATANSTGGVMGKMIDAQSIVVSAAATDQPGREGAILRFVFGHSLLLAVLMGLLVLLQAYLLPGMIPAGE